MRMHRAGRGRRAIAIIAIVSGVWMGTGTRRAGAEIIGVLEAPDGIASGVGNIAGWAYTTEAGESILSPIEVYVDGLKRYEVPCCSGRGDVKAARPDAPLETGFSGLFNWGLLEPGAHDVDVAVRSTGGELRVFEAEITTVRVGEGTFLSRLRFTDD